MVNFQGSPTYERPCMLCSTNLRVHLPRSCTGPDPAVVPPLDVNDDYTEWHRSGQSTIPPKVAEVSPPNLAEGRRRNAARIGPHPRFTDPMSGLAYSVPRIFGHIYRGAAPGTAKVPHLEVNVNYTEGHRPKNAGQARPKISAHQAEIHKQVQKCSIAT